MPKAYLITQPEYLTTVAPLLKEFKTFLKKNNYFVHTEYGGYGLRTYPELFKAMTNREDAGGARWNFAKKESWQTPEEQLEYYWKQSVESAGVSKDVPPEVIEKKNEYISKLNDIFDERYVKHSLLDSDNSKSNKRSIRYAIDNDVYIGLLQAGETTIEKVKEVAESAGVRLPKKVLDMTPLEQRLEAKYDALYKEVPPVNREQLQKLVQDIELSFKDFSEQIFEQEYHRNLENIKKIQAKPDITNAALHDLMKYKGVFEPVGKRTRVELHKFRNKKGYERTEEVSFYAIPPLVGDWNKNLITGVKEYIETLKLPLISSILNNFSRISKPIASFTKQHIDVGHAGMEAIFNFKFTDGSSFDYETKAIVAGGYNIQVLHLRYISDFKNVRLAGGVKPEGSGLLDIVENFSDKELREKQNNPFLMVESAETLTQLIDGLYKYLKSGKAGVSNIRKYPASISYTKYENHHERPKGISFTAPPDGKKPLELPAAKEKALKFLTLTLGLKQEGSPDAVTPTEKVLYHGTIDKFKQSILDNGITNGMLGSSYDEALRFARMKSYRYGNEGSTPIIFEVVGAEPFISEPSEPVNVSEKHLGSYFTILKPIPKENVTLMPPPAKLKDGGELAATKEQLLFTSDKIRLAHIKNALNSEVDTSDIDDEMLLDTWEGYEDLTVCQNNGDTLLYKEGWVDSCWEGLYTKQEYKGLSHEQAVKKFMDERFSEIVKLLNLEVEVWNFDDDILTVVIKRPATFKQGGLLAPNGKPSNLTAEQYRLVRTPDFFAWFGDWLNSPETASKVVDSNGEPLVVVHKTDLENDFSVFDKEKIGEANRFTILNGFFFGNYTKVSDGLRNVVSFLNIRNPIILNESNTYFDSVGYQEAAQHFIQNGTADYLREYLEYEEYGADEIDSILKKWETADGVIVKNLHYAGFNTEVVAFNTEQIKLADGSNTTFDAANPDIRFDKGGLLAPNGKRSNLTPAQYKLVRTPAFKAWFGDWLNSPETASKVVDSNGEPLVVYHGTTNGIRIKYNYNWLYNKEEDKIKSLFVQYKAPFNIFEVKEKNHIGSNLDYLNTFFSNDFWVAYEYAYNFTDNFGGRGMSMLGEFTDINGDILSNERPYPVIINNERTYYDSPKKEKGHIIGYIYSCFLNIKNPLIVDFKNERFDKKQDFIFDDVIYNLDSVGIVDYAKKNNYNGVIIENILDGAGRKATIDNIDYVIFNNSQIKLADGTNTTFDAANPDIRFEKGGNVITENDFIGTWSELQKQNPDLWETGILRRSLKPLGYKGVIPEDIHTKQGQWQNYGQYDEIEAETIYGQPERRYGYYLDKDGEIVDDMRTGYALSDTWDDNNEKIKATISNEQLKNNLIESFDTEEGKDYLRKVIAALPKNPDGSITAYRIGNTGEGIKSYTVSEGMAKTFSNQGTDIMPAGLLSLPTEGYKDFGVLPANVVKINPKGIVAWSPYDSEILVEAKYVKTQSQITDIRNKSNNPQRKLNEGGIAGGEALIAPNGKPSNLTAKQYNLVHTPAFKAWFGDWENSPETSSKVVDENGEPLPVYHGTDAEFNVFDQSKIGYSTGNYGHYGYGFYFSDDVREAKGYGSVLLNCFLNIKNPFYNEDNHFDLLKEKGVSGIDEKIAISIDFDDLYSKVKLIDDKAAEFLMLAKENGIDNAWPMFLETNKPSDSRFDLNDLYDTVQYTTLGSPDGVPDYVLDFIKSMGIEVKINMGYAYHPSLHWITDLGRNAKSVTDDIKELGFDGVIVGSEYVPFEPTQIKLADGTNTTFDAANPDIRFEKGGSLKLHGDIISGKEIKKIFSKLKNRQGDDYVEFATQNIRSASKYMLSELPINDLLSRNEDVADYVKSELKNYKPGRKIETPILIGDSELNGKYGVTDGYGRITQAIANGEKAIAAYVDVSDIIKLAHEFLKLYPVYNTPEEDTGSENDCANVSSAFISFARKAEQEDYYLIAGIEKPVMGNSIHHVAVLHKPTGIIIDFTYGQFEEGIQAKIYTLAQFEEKFETADFNFSMQEDNYSDYDTNPFDKSVPYYNRKSEFATGGTLPIDKYSAEYAPDGSMFHPYDLRIEFRDILYNTEPPVQDIERLNKWLRENKMKYVKLYHGAPADDVNSILEKGLLPTSGKRKHSKQSQEGYVYLSVLPKSSMMFADFASPQTEGENTVFEVVQPIYALLPDTDQLNNYRGAKQNWDIGNTLGESIIYGHGARVKGKIDRFAFRVIPTSDIAYFADGGAVDMSKFKMKSGETHKEWIDRLKNNKEYEELSRQALLRRKAESDKNDFSFKEIELIAKSVKGFVYAHMANRFSNFNEILFNKYTTADIAIKELKKKGYSVSERMNNPANTYFKFKIVVTKAPFFEHGGKINFVPDYVKWDDLSPQQQNEIADQIYNASDYLKSNYNPNTFKEYLDNEIDFKIPIVELDVKSANEIVAESWGLSEPNLKRVREFEELYPVIVNDGVFYDGGHRVKVAFERGMETMPAYEISHLLNWDWKKYDDGVPLPAYKMKQGGSLSPNIVSGIFYRVDTGLVHAPGTTAADVVNYEVENLKNKNVQLGLEKAKASGIDLSEYAAKDIVWVTKTKEDATRYGDIESVKEVKVDSGIIIAEDGGGSFLVLDLSGRNFEKGGALSKYPDIKWVISNLRNNSASHVDYPVLDAFIVGSEAKGTAKPESDLDIAVIIPKSERITALKRTENYQAKFMRESYKPHWNDRVVDFQFFYEDDAELDGYSKIQLTGKSKFEDGGSISAADEEKQTYIDILAYNSTNPAFQKYKVLLKEKFDFDFDELYNKKDLAYIADANLSDIKAKDDFLSFDNYILYAKKIFQLRGLAAIQPRHLAGEIAIKEAAEIGDILSFKVKHREYDGGAGDLASHDLIDTIIMPNILDINSFIHELGHHFDHFESKGYTGLAKSITYASSPYHIDKSNEVFAENFMHYFIAPEWMKENMQEIYLELDSKISPKYKQVVISLIEKYNSSLIKGGSLRDLEMERQGGAFISGLEKGMKVKVGSHTYEVLSRKVTLRLKREDGKTLTIKTIYNQNYGNALVMNFFRDIEGDITLDLLNENNRLHNVYSDAYNIAKAQVEKYKDGGYVSSVKQNMFDIARMHKMPVEKIKASFIAGTKKEDEPNSLKRADIVKTNLIANPEFYSDIITVPKDLLQSGQQSGQSVQIEPMFIESGRESGQSVQPEPQKLTAKETRSMNQKIKNFIALLEENGLLSAPEQKYYNAVYNVFKSEAYQLDNRKLDAFATKFGITDNAGNVNKGLIKELTELAICNYARQMAHEPGTVKERYENIVAFYHQQPLMSHRTSQSILFQQYSTPVPVCYLAGVFCGIDEKEPEKVAYPAVVSAKKVSSGQGYKAHKGIGGSLQRYEVEFSDGHIFATYRAYDRNDAIEAAKRDYYPRLERTNAAVKYYKKGGELERLLNSPLHLTENIEKIKKILAEDKDKYYLVEEDSLSRIAKGIIDVDDILLKYSPITPIRTSFGEYAFFYPDNRHILREGVEIAYIKYAAHFVSSLKPRKYDNSKHIALKHIEEILLGATHRFIQKNKDETESIIYVKEIIVSDNVVVVLMAEISLDGEIRVVTTLPNRNGRQIQKKIDAGVWIPAAPISIPLNIIRPSVDVIDPSSANKDGQQRNWDKDSGKFDTGGVFDKNNNIQPIFFEPSAGNGNMTIAGKPENFIVNEIDKVRNRNLQTIGYKEVMNIDASEPFKQFEKKFDAMLTNPPFGTMETNISFNGMPIKKLEHAMAIYGLQTIKDNGRAAIIIGGHTVYDDQGRIQKGQNRDFFSYLYRYYYVQDVINLAGDIYNRQGTSIGTRIILISGRKLKPEGFPPLHDSSLENTDVGSGKIVNNFIELFERISKSVNN